MPVSWQSRLRVRSATAMFSTIVSRMVLPVASVSSAISRSKPCLMSRGSNLSALM